MHSAVQQHISIQTCQRSIGLQGLSSSSVIKVEVAQQHQDCSHRGLVRRTCSTHFHTLFLLEPICSSWKGALKVVAQNNLRAELLD
jgi:hypothetical protein